MKEPGSSGARGGSRATGICPRPSGASLIIPWFPRADEEPFLIFANRYYLRKLNLDGSNYTLLKQVQEQEGAPAPRGQGLGVGEGPCRAGDLPAWAFGLSPPRQGVCDP